MGYNTVAVLYNDFTGEYKTQGERIGQRIAEAMRDYHDKDRSRRNFGAGVVVSQDHADGEQVVVVHANYGYRADEATGLGWMALQQMAACLERHGYKVTKPRPKQAKRPPKLTAPQTEFLAEVRRRSPRRVVAGYKPALRLRDLGLIVIEEREGSYAWECSPASPTPEQAGRE